MTGRNRWQWLILAALFLLLFLFFNATAQFLPWNGDDWRYLSQYRPPYPTLRLWNPARVFPEVLQPLLGLMSASLVWPLTDTYPDAVRITACISATVCICCLAWAVRQLLCAMTARDSVALFGMLLFVAFAFFLFKNKTDGNIYLFYASSITILCFYQIPNIANAVLALGLLSAHFYGWPRLRGRWPLQGCLVLFTLCALFSMTTASLISATCAATLVLVRLLGSPGTGLRQKIASRIRNATGFDSYLFFILACWFAAALLDVNGTRYAHLTPSGFHLADTVALTRGLLANMRFSAIIVTVAAAGAAILHAGWELRRMQRERERERETSFFSV